MRLIVTIGLASVGLAVLSACTPSPLDENWPPPRPLGGDAPAYRPPRDPGAARVTADRPGPTGELTLREALAAALLRNPRLAAYGWRVRAAEARVLQAGLWPNPELEAEIENVAGSGESSGIENGETTIRLSQEVLTGGEIAKRSRIAELERDLEAWDYEAARLDVFTDVVRNFVAVLAAQQRLEVGERTFKLAEEILQTVSRQVEAGAVSAVERTRAGVALAQGRVEFDRARRALDAARVALAESLGSAEPTFDEVRGDLASVEAAPPFEAVIGLLAQNPALARWSTELARREAAIELARAEAVPDFAVGAGVKHSGETDDVGGVLSVAVPLPIFDRNQGEILAARFELARARAEQEATRVELGAELGRSYHNLAAAYEAVQTLRGEALPGAREAYQAIRESFRQGQASFLDVLDAQRTLFEIEAQVVEALAEYHQVAAGIERLIAQPLSSVHDVAPESAQPAPASTEPAREAPIEQQPKEQTDE